LRRGRIFDANGGASHEDHETIAAVTQAELDELWAKDGSLAILAKALTIAAESRRSQPEIIEESKQEEANAPTNERRSGVAELIGAILASYSEGFSKAEIAGLHHLPYEVVADGVRGRLPGQVWEDKASPETQAWLEKYYPSEAWKPVQLVSSQAEPARKSWRPMTKEEVRLSMMGEPIASTSPSGRTRKIRFKDGIVLQTLAGPGEDLTAQGPKAQPLEIPDMPGEDLLDLAWVPESQLTAEERERLAKAEADLRLRSEQSEGSLKDGED
jgi:hypothetical protein